MLLYDREMDFAVLGPLRVTVGDVPVAVPGLKERTVLAHLVAYAGRMVPSADLVESLWAQDPPRSALKSLQTYVFRLRNCLEPERGPTPAIIVTEAAGYRLDIDPDLVDATRFTQLAALGRRALDEGRPQAATQTLDAALTLWRGPAYAGFDTCRFAIAEGRRLEEARVCALEDRCAAGLALGHAAASVGELKRLLAEHPFRARLWALLALALYRCGRQGEALGALARARAVLNDELGVDPGPELTELHRRLLAQDPSLHLLTSRSPVPPELSGAMPPLVGRVEELSRLRDAWSRAANGAAVGIALRGPAGAGATRLAAALAGEVAHSGASVRYAHGDVVSTRGPEPTSGLVVFDHAPSAPPVEGVLVLLLLGEHAAVPSWAEPVQLGPLDRSEVEDLVRDYVASAHLERAAEEVYGQSGGWPGRAHEAAFEVCRRLTSDRVDVALLQIHASSTVLASARSDLADGVAVLRRQAPTGTPPDGECPWRGLRHYEVSDARWFYGRERLVAELVARLGGSRLVGVVGASGSGKSSLVRAGLLAALTDDTLPGSAAWSQVVLRPGEHPLRELAIQAIGTHHQDMGQMLQHLIRVGEDDAVAQRMVLVVDQLEELWTVCSDTGEAPDPVRRLCRGGPRGAVPGVGTAAGMGPRGRQRPLGAAPSYGRGGRVGRRSRAGPALARGPSRRRLGRGPEPTWRDDDGGA